MDVAAVRVDLETAAKACCYSAFSYEPDDPGNLPAAVVGGIESMVRLNRFVTKLQIGVTFYCSLGNDAGASATRFLDATFSVGTGTGFLDHLAAEITAGHMTTIKADNWAFVSASRYVRYQLPSGDFALGSTMTIELTG